MTTVETRALRPLALPRVRIGTRAWALAPAGAYLAGQAVTLLYALLVTHAHHRSLYRLLSSWDGQWYLDVAEHGYKTTVERGGTVAFFPGYPMLLRALHAATRIGYQQAGIAVSVAAGVATAYGLMRLVDGRRAGLITVALFASAPVSIVLAATYSEAVFCAIAVWALVAIRDQRWLTAAALIVGAGLTRSSAVALFAALVIAVVIAARAGRADWRAVLSLAVAPVGLIGYLAWVSHATHTPSGWFAAQSRGWGTRFDFGYQTGRLAYAELVTGANIYGVVVVAVLAAAIALCVRLWRDRYTLLATYATVVVVMDVATAGIMSSKVRMLAPAFPLLIPVARWLAAQERRRMVGLLVLFALFGAWFSANLATSGLAF